MRGMMWLALAGAALLSAGPALADAKTYCEAFARDQASSRYVGSGILTGKRTPVTPDQWAAARDEIYASCLSTFTERPAPRTLTKNKTTVAAAAPVDATDLKPGSDAWKAYCAKKYVSFDAVTGLYTGMSGKKRPCLVTKN